MSHIICSQTLSSLLSATLLRDMLQMRDSSIIWKVDHLATEKNITVIDIDTYTQEYLVAEYERRYGQISWFHDHTEAMHALRERMQDYVSNSFEAEPASFAALVDAILHNRLETVHRLLDRRQLAGNALQLLTSPFVKAGWAS